MTSSLITNDYVLMI